MEPVVFAKELSDIAHECNNLFNTLNGYIELADEARESGNQAEFELFKDKLYLTLSKKISIAKELSRRINVIKEQVQRGL
jgi:hypothetical protein